MNDDTNNLNVNSTEGIKDDFKIDTTKFADMKKVGTVEAKEVVEATSGLENAEVKAEETNVEVPAEEELTSNEVPAESTQEAVISSETVIEADVNAEISTNEEVVVGTIEEVSVAVDSDSFNNLSEAEVSENSVFNKKEAVVEGSMKEGAEVEKKGFPFFMILVFIGMVVAAFYIDDIVVAVQKYQDSKKPVVEDDVVKKDENKDNKVKAKTLTLTEIYNSLSKSKYVIDFETKSNIELSILTEDNNLLFTTTNYLNNSVENSTLDAHFKVENNILSINTTMDNSAFSLEMAIILVKEIAFLQDVTIADLDSYISNNLYTQTIDKGFEFTNSEDGNNFYQIAMNVKLEEEKDK